MEISCLFSQLVQNGKVLEHPEVQQHQDIPAIEQDTFLNMVVQPNAQVDSPSDPNDSMTHNHLLSPLAERASMIEQAMIQGTIPVSNIYQNLKKVSFFYCLD